MAQLGRPGMSVTQKAELWRRWKGGELPEPLILRFACRQPLLRPSLLGLEAIETPVSSCVAPGGEVRAVKPFPAKQGAQLAALGAGVGLHQDPLLVGRGEPTSTSFFRHLGRRSYSLCLGIHENLCPRPLH